MVLVTRALGASPNKARTHQVLSRDCRAYSLNSNRYFSIVHKYHPIRCPRKFYSYQAALRTRWGLDYFPALTSLVCLASWTSWTNPIKPARKSKMCAGLNPHCTFGFTVAAPMIRLRVATLFDPLYQPGLTLYEKSIVVFHHRLKEYIVNSNLVSYSEIQWVLVRDFLLLSLSHGLVTGQLQLLHQTWKGKRHNFVYMDLSHPTLGMRLIAGETHGKLYVKKRRGTTLWPLRLDCRRHAQVLGRPRSYRGGHCS